MIRRQKLAEVIVSTLFLFLFTVLSAAAQNYSQLFQFPADGVSGLGSDADLVSDSSGNLYGTTYYGGDMKACLGGCGVAFELSQSGGIWTETVLHTFSNLSDGQYPTHGLVIDKAGNLYGVAFNGGNTTAQECLSIGCGLVFELSPQGSGWTETILHKFTGYDPNTGKNDGADPFGGLTIDDNGILYGTTLGGGAPDYGTVFALEQTKNGWDERTLYSFKGGTEGSGPLGGLTLDAAGNLYGTTAGGGPCCGLVYKLTRNGSHFTGNLLYAFSSPEKGREPLGRLTFDSKGDIYGATYYGGDLSACSNGCGTIFQLKPNGNKWTETVIHTFEDADGQHPEAGVTAVNDTLYGVAHFGGTFSCGMGLNCGVLYDLTESNGTWNQAILHDFQGAPDGEFGVAALLYNNGTLYGTTHNGGIDSNTCTTGCGTVFQFVP